MKSNLTLRLVLLPALVAFVTAGVMLSAADPKSERKAQRAERKAPAKADSGDAPAPKTPLKLAVDSTPIDREGFDRVSYAPIVRRTAGIVVYVHASKTVRGQDLTPFLNDPMLRRFFEGPGNGGSGRTPRRPNNRMPDQEQQGLGSGVVITSDGYILTNNHVIDGADELKVSIGESTRRHTAKVVGRDPLADLAVLKIDASSLTLTPAVFSDSDQLQVGDVVLAIGNPFGVGLSVSRGIVSALSRGVGIGVLEDFIQTDAAINPGNSGGALIDTRGRVVGINTAILSRSGGFNGVGFAIPINLARNIAEQIVNTGRVERGMLGVRPQDLDEELTSQFGTEKGVIISEVTADGPAAKAGLRAGDVITKVNGREVNDARQLLLTVGQLAPNTEVTVDYVRDGQAASVKAKLVRRTEEFAGRDAAPAGQDVGVLNGVTVGDLTREIRERFRIPDRIQGAIITDIEPDSPSAKQGLQEGDVIQQLDRRPVTNAEEAVKLSEEIKGPKTSVLVWNRTTGPRFLVIDESKK